MLKMDERNFHCWNYRYWVVDMFLSEIKLRVKEMTPELKDDEVTIWTKFQQPLVQEECKMALGLIHKNFSNYSAWHYRAKLMPKFYTDNDLRWNCGYVIPLENIKEDLSTLKHAFFTDPKD